MIKLKSFLINNQRVVINNINYVNNFVKNNNLNNYNYKSNGCKISSLSFHNNKYTNRIFNIHKKDSPEELLNRAENANLLRLVTSYRTYGHKNGDIDPLGIIERE